MGMFTTNLCWLKLVKFSMTSKTVLKKKYQNSSALYTGCSVLSTVLMDCTETGYG